MENDKQFKLKSQIINLAKCSKGNQATVACCSQYCKHKAFVCKDEECQCRKPHKLCFQMVLSKLQEIIMASSYCLKPLQDKIQQLFDRAIDRLSQERDKFLSKIKEEFDYFGLNPSEKKFIYALKNGQDSEQINCQFIWKIHAELKEEECKTSYWLEIENQIKVMDSQLTQQLNKFDRKMTNFLLKIHARDNTNFLSSKIATTSEYRMNLSNFFDNRKVVSTDLLYRASENSFLVSKFHQNCDNFLNTLILVHTEFDKIIGGFTSYGWRRSTSKSNEYVKGDINSENHFIFSLSNNHKFLLTKNAGNCIFYRFNDDWGPCFGCGFDLGLYDKANENNNSCAVIGTSYTNENYELNGAASQRKFSGGKLFKVKEWEVWKIAFEQ